jgi:putative tryptophan/tyrosine transport system substrate-binding protein
MRRREFIALLGGGVIWPLWARAASKDIPTVGVLWHAGSAEEEEPFFSALREGFKDLGYIEGKNIRLEDRFPNEVPERFKSMLAELVALDVDVIVSVAPASLYARDATGTIPHVFVFVPDAVGLKFVNSLARPGGIATGLSVPMFGLTRKRVQLTNDAIPGLASIGLLVDPLLVASTQATKAEAQAAATEIGLSLQTFEASSLDELEGAFNSMTRASMQALVVNGTGLFYKHRANIAKLAMAHRLPTTVWAREAMEPGFLMSYGASLTAIVKRAPTYVDRILKGEKPADIPVEEPTRYEFVVNAKLAKAFGIEVPAIVLARADEVIE